MTTYTGGCVKCGYCCKYMTMPFPDSPYTHEWLLARGWRKVLSNGEVAMYTIRHPCPNLKGNNTCRVHLDKPVMCKAYPHNLGDARLLGKCKGFKAQ